MTASWGPSRERIALLVIAESNSVDVDSEGLSVKDIEEEREMLGAWVRMWLMCGEEGVPKMYNGKEPEG